MFERNITDTTGLEPFQLFNVVQFLMYDKDCSGNVSVDETMHMLYSRYGKANLESQMKALFGDDLKTADGDGELSFNEYVLLVRVRPPPRSKSTPVCGGAFLPHRYLARLQSFLLMSLAWLHVLRTNYTYTLSPIMFVVVRGGFWWFVVRVPRRCCRIL